MSGADPLPPTVRWDDGAVVLVDQRALPEALVFLHVTTVDDLCEAIRGLAVRGAPALGVAGAFGVALAAATGEDVPRAAQRIVATRPTAVNLAWGVHRALRAADPLAEAQRLAAEDVAVNRQLSAIGAELLDPGARVLTHCNAGGLACAGYGTALGVVRFAHEAGRQPSVWVRETRPLLQGSRITAWELTRLGIPTTVVADMAAATLMQRGLVDCCLVGADRVAANGDVANKIGTYELAVLAHFHGVPFYVAAPTSTVDLACASGSSIPIEQRPGEELRWFAETLLVPGDAAVANPAFDVTPGELVTAVITERGIARPPFGPPLAQLLSAPG
jgi:methylthioribose-1-phosphate isomerase